MKKQLSPQVAAVASLIYEKEITTFDDTGCVEGSWCGDDHKKMIPESKFCVIAGARFPDKEISGIKGMTSHPYWHGYFTNKAFDADINYIKSVVYIHSIIDEYKVANGKVTGKKVGSLTGYKKTIVSDLDKICNEKVKNEWSAVHNEHSSQNFTNGFLRAFLWGMLIHTTTDIYAHSANYKDGRLYHPKDLHPAPADDPEIPPARYEDASNAAKALLNRYDAKDDSLALSDYITVKKYKDEKKDVYTYYKLVNLKDYIETAYSYGTAVKYNYASYNYVTYAK